MVLRAHIIYLSFTHCMITISVYPLTRISSDNFVFHFIILLSQISYRFTELIHLSMVSINFASRLYYSINYILII